MARVLIVGCGCRGRALARRLADDGHAVRGTTRDPARTAVIEAVAAEPWVGDPQRLATMTGALDAVTVVCWLLASAHGSAQHVRALHDERLAAFLRELVDSTVRGFVYEAVGSADPAVLARGRELTAVARRTWQLPAACVEAEPGRPDEWTRAAYAAVRSLLAGAPPGA